MQSLAKFSVFVAIMMFVPSAVVAQPASSLPSSNQQISTPGALPSAPGVYALVKNNYVSMKVPELRRKAALSRRFWEADGQTAEIQLDMRRPSFIIVLERVS
jgi:hypothetical protein